jgi:hypothetical protein
MVFYCIAERGFLDSLTVSAKNSAGFKTKFFLFTVKYAIWFIVHFTLQPALFLACVVVRFFSFQKRSTGGIPISMFDGNSNFSSLKERLVRNLVSAFTL